MGWRFQVRAIIPTAAAAALLICGGCKEEEDLTAGDECEFALDGVCDEPTNCALGTDSTDCIAACDSGGDLHLFAAACAFRDPPSEPPDDGDGSGGSVHLTGWLDGIVEVPSGELLAETIPRHYRLYVPAAYDPGRSAPLVIMLPGHRVSHYDLAGYTELARSADLNDFLFVLAEQQYRWDGEHRWAWWTDWSWSSNAEANPDFDYLEAVIDRMSAEYDVDRSRVFLVGHSRGGAMAFIGALELDHVVAGACIQSGFTEFGYLDARLDTWDGRKVPMVFVHGIQDPDVSVVYGDRMVERIDELGWVEGEDYVYHRLDQVKHRWQPWLNQSWWDFLHARPLTEGE